MSTTDADLVRYIDGELTDDERARIDAAIAADPALAQRLEQLRRRGGNLGKLLDRTDVPFEGDVRAIDSAPGVRARPWQRPSLQAAAAVLLLLGAIALVPPLRAWVASQFERLTDSGAATQESVPLEAAETVDTLVVQFVNPHPSFDIELLSHQAGGRLIVRVEATDSVRFELRQVPGGPERSTVLSGGIRIFNTPESTAEYEVVVPATVRRIGIIRPGMPREDYSTLDTANHRRVFEFGGR